MIECLMRFISVFRLECFLLIRILWLRLVFGLIGGWGDRIGMLFFIDYFVGFF